MLKRDRNYKPPPPAPYKAPKKGHNPRPEDCATFTPGCSSTARSLAQGILVLMMMLQLCSRIARRRPCSRPSATSSRCGSPSRRGSSKTSTAPRQVTLPTSRSRLRGSMSKWCLPMRIRTVSALPTRSLWPTRGFMRMMMWLTSTQSTER